jgi:hypothetical protein
VVTGERTRGMISSEADLLAELGVDSFQEIRDSDHFSEKRITLLKLAGRLEPLLLEKLAQEFSAGSMPRLLPPRRSCSTGDPTCHSTTGSKRSTGCSAA